MEYCANVHRWSSGKAGMAVSAPDLGLRGVGGRLCGACSRFGFEGAVCPELPVFLRFG